MGQVSEEDLNTEARSLSLGLARIYCAGLLLEQAEWAIKKDKNPRSLLVARRFMEKGLFEEFRSSEKHRQQSRQILQLK